MVQNIIKNETSRRFRGVLGALGFMKAERHAAKGDKWSRFGATWSISFTIFGAHWISKDRSARCFSMHLAQPHQLEHSYIFEQLCR